MIGDNVWIGGGAQLLPGVTIGSNVVIGAGSVVTHDIPTTASLSAIPAGCCGGCRRTAKFLRKLAKRRRLWYNNHIQ